MHGQGALQLGVTSREVLPEWRGLWRLDGSLRDGPDGVQPHQMHRRMAFNRTTGDW